MTVFTSRSTLRVAVLVALGVAQSLVVSGRSLAQRGGRGGADAPAEAPTSAPRLPKGPRAMMLADWYRVSQVSAPAMSPDGKRIAMTVTRAVEAENRRHSEIWVVNSAGGDPQRWTSPSTESSNPRWSPDGKYLLFTSQRPGGRGNTWAIRLDEPGGEAIQVDGYAEGSLPSNSAFAITAGPARQDPPARNPADPFARMQPMAKPPFDGITRPAEPARFDGRHVVDMSYKANGAGFVPGRATARAWRPQQVWRQTMGDTARKMLSNTAYSHRLPTVSPDGQWIAFVAESNLRPDSVVELERDSIAKLPYNKARDDVDRNDADIYVMAANGGTPRKVADWMGAESDLSWSADSKRIAFIGRPGRTKSARIYLVDAAGGTPRNIIGNWQYEPSSIEWLSNGSLMLTADIGGRSAILEADSGGKAV
ncbi:MAG: hypothetical protein ABMA00_15920, partial [Gemmatimonas sp.]